MINFDSNNLNTSAVSKIILDDLTNGDTNLDSAYAALEAFVSGQTQDVNEGDFTETANKIGFTIVTALRLAAGDESGQFREFAFQATESLSAIGQLETKDVDNIIYTDLNNGDTNLDSAYAALEALVSGRTSDTAEGDFTETANNVGNAITQALRLAAGDESGQFREFAFQATESLSQIGQLETKDVDNIIYNDLRNEDTNLDSAYAALEALVSGRTSDTAEGDFTETANNVGNAITQALRLANGDESGQFREFAFQATESLSQIGQLETKDVDNIIYNDLRNEDTNLDSAYVALEALVSGRTSDTAEGDFTETANNVGNAIIRALSLAAGDESGQFREFASQATNSLSQIGQLETKDVDNIIRMDLINGDANFDSAYTALDAFVSGRTNETNEGDFQETAGRIGNEIVRALQLAESEGDQGFTLFANYATEALAQSGLLETKDVDNIIFADLSNGDTNLDSAYIAIDALVTGRTQDTDEGDFKETADRVGNAIVRALNLAGAENAPEFAFFASYAADRLAQSGLLETQDVDNIMFADLNNGDTDLDASYIALEAFVTGRTQDTNEGDFKETADRIGNAIVRALNLAESEDAPEFAFFASFATDSLAQSGLLETQDVDNIIVADLFNGDTDLDAAYIGIEAFVTGRTQDTNEGDFKETADRIGDAIVRALNLAESEDAPDFAFFASYATDSLAQSGLLETVDVDDIIFADLTNGDSNLDSAYIAIEAFVTGRTQDTDEGDFMATAEEIVQTINEVSGQSGLEGEIFAETAADLLSGIIDTSSLV